MSWEYQSLGLFLYATRTTPSTRHTNKNIGIVVKQMNQNRVVYWDVNKHTHNVT